jgi:crotonobetainyl-CoA:carnitine CoA-transferase CaiB-like acyl-CoA transferase
MSKTLEDIKIADFTWVVAGPLCVRYLADYGAQVIHVETGTRIDPIRYTPPYKDDIPGTNRGGYFHNYNSNKYGITLNLRHPKALELAKKLILWADIVAENFNPGVMKRLRLSYEEVKEIKPDIIMISLGSKGQTGPQARLPAFGAHLAALSGFTAITGWPDRDPPVIFGAYTDSIAGRFGAATLLDYDVNRRILERSGNRHSSAAPHGAYRCKGEDRWCAIAVFTDQEWKAMRQVMGSPPWAEDNKFATLLGRKSNEEELDSLIEQWTINYSAEEVMDRLQQAGVSAGVVETAEDLHSDPQLEYRHHFWVLKHQEIGKSTYDSMGSHLSKTPAELHKAAHTLGEDNHYVYTQILGLSDGEFVELLEEGVFD